MLRLTSSYGIFFLLYLCYYLRETRGENIIINSDAGADDAIAILLMLRYEAATPKPAHKLIAITCSYGNTKEENVENNILRTLTIAGRTDIPVYRGAKRGYLEKFSTDYYFGSDGFSDAVFEDKLSVKIDKSKHAAVALVDLINKYAGNVSIISLGPLTNIGLAISLDNSIVKKVNQFYVMGSSIAGNGNYKPNVEYNFGEDPESALLLFDAVEESQIILFPWETSLNTNISKDWRINFLGKFDSPIIRFMNKVEKNSLANKGRVNWVSSDAAIVACLIEPALITSKLLRNVDVVTDYKARGSVLVDYNKNYKDKILNSNIILAFNDTLYSEMLLLYLTCVKFSCPHK